MTLSLDTPNEWVTRMAGDGGEHGPAVFDGWGARVPDGVKPTKGKRKRGLLGRLPR